MKVTDELKSKVGLTFGVELSDRVVEAIATEGDLLQVVQTLLNNLRLSMFVGADEVPRVKVIYRSGEDLYRVVARWDGAQMYIELPEEADPAAQGRHYVGHKPVEFGIAEKGTEYSAPPDGRTGEHEDAPGNS